MRRFGYSLLTILLGGLLTAVLVRFAPGFGVDERELDSRLRADSVAAIRAEHHWSLGYSQSLGRPIAELFADRLPLTLRNVTLGFALGCIVGLAGAIAAVGFGVRADLPASAAAGMLLCLPASVTALAFLYAFSAPRVAPAIAVVVFPRIFRYSRGILLQSAASAHVQVARARGLPLPRILFTHVLRPAAGSLAALAGATAAIAFGAAIPIEVICDSPGIGQLAWQAAMQRDLPLLIEVGFAVTAITVLCNAAAEAWS